MYLSWSSRLETGHFQSDVRNVITEIPVLCSFVVNECLCILLIILSVVPEDINNHETIHIYIMVSLKEIKSRNVKFCRSEEYI